MTIVRTIESASSTLAICRDLTDDEVVARVLDGDIARFECLMRRHNQRLYRLARAVVRNDADAEDVLQEAYARAFAKLSSFEGRSSVVTWLSRIVYHEALRRELKERTVRKTIREKSERGTHDPGRYVSAESEASARELASAVAEAIDGLPSLLRQVAVLRLVQELDTRGTARCLGMTELGVRVALHRARGRLARTLGRDTLSELPKQMVFDGDRCDRIVRSVMIQLLPNG